jgi:hypothetical protein
MSKIKGNQKEYDSNGRQCRPPKAQPTKTKEKQPEYYIDKSKSIRKSIIIYRIKGSVHSPIMYISKPKFITENEFNDFINNMQIFIK